MIAVFLITFTIELLQLVTHRRLFELTDIIENTCGGAIGYGLYCTTKRLLHREVAL